MLHKLWTSCHIMSSDEDQPAVEDLYVGFDASMCMVVTIEHIDYERPEYNCSVSAIVSKEDAFKLSQKLKVTMSQLPNEISESMGEYADIVNADFSDVRECFKTVLDCFIGEKCPYKIVRKYGKQGFICG